MKYLRSDEIRKVFLEFFERKEHKVVESSPLIPAEDPTLLFTTAGMVQFKPYFLREKTPPFSRATSVQKCLRAGGKASDLENVGKTPRHHTFFEMLGNFSFGDYFKKEAIEFAWEFVTEVVEIDRDLLWVSVYENDEEAFEIWNKRIGIDKDRIVRFGEKDNFWGPPGEEGPCGPCSEIYIDLRERWKYNKNDCKTPENCDGFLEFWNLVFMQYYQDRNGKRTELDFKGIDTGMGLERLAMILQNKQSVYETDIFEPIIRKITEETNKKYEGDNIVPINVIADHTRALTFVGAEGIYPSNEGRGYVMRRILRRALRYASKMGVNGPIIYKIVDGVVAAMGKTYPEIAEKKESIKKVIKLEEEKYFCNISKGIDYLSQIILKLKDMRQNVLPGSEVFKLYDSMGVPLDVIEDVCRDENINIDWTKFNELMEEQKQRGKLSWKRDDNLDFSVIVRQENPTRYVGEECFECDSTIKRLYTKEGNTLLERDFLEEGEVGIMVVDETPFYGEGGGQVGDTGMAFSEENTSFVLDTKKNNDVHLHVIRVEKGRFRVGDKVRMSVDINRKMNIARHHTATHILHFSLRKVLGEHVVQSGSLVEPNRLRFDFSHYSALTPEDIKKVEDEANEIVLRNVEVVKRVLPKSEALKTGALAFFGEKYGENVRIVEIPGFSKEFCGGTHVNRTGDIGIIKIIEEKSIASGIRRIEAVAGKQALEELRKYYETVETISRQLGSKVEDIPQRIENLIKRVKELEKNRTAPKGKTVSLEEILKSTEKVGNYNFIFSCLKEVDLSSLGAIIDRAKDNVENVVIFLATERTEGINFASGTNASSVDLQKLVKSMESIGVKGGGRRDFVRGAIAKEISLDKVRELILNFLENLST